MSHPKTWSDLNTIYFHSKDGAYHWLSNFYTLPRNENMLKSKNGIWFKHVEAFFQAHKYQNREDAHAIMMQFSELSPQQAKKKGGKSGLKMSMEELKEWDTKRVDIMREAIRQKFQHPLLRDLLKMTDDTILVERLPMFQDDFWGVKNNKTKENWGCNMLGQIIMQYRAQLN